MNFLRKISCETYLRSSLPTRFFHEKEENACVRELSFFSNTYDKRNEKHTDLVKPSCRDKTDTEKSDGGARALPGYRGTHASARRRLYCSSIFYRAIYLYRPLLNDENFIANCRGRKGFYGCLCRSRVFISIPGALSPRVSRLAAANHVASAIENSCPLSSSGPVNERILIEIFLKRKVGHLHFGKLHRKNRRTGEKRNLFVQKLKSNI